MTDYGTIKAEAHREEMPVETRGPGAPGNFPALEKPAA